MASLASVVAKFANQTIVAWQCIGFDNFGKPRFADPVEMKCRWEDKLQEIWLSDERKVMAHGYLLMSPPGVPPGSWVWLGTLPQWQALPNFPALPTNGQGGREIIKNNTTPDIQGSDVVSECFI